MFLFSSHPAHDVRTTLYGPWSDIEALQWRRNNVVLTPCTAWLVYLISCSSNRRCCQPVFFWSTSNGISNRRPTGQSQRFITGVQSLSYYGNGTLSLLLPSVGGMGLSFIFNVLARDTLRNYKLLQVVTNWILSSIYTLLGEFQKKSTMEECIFTTQYCILSANSTKTLFSRVTF